jgi:hypothetical protein
MHKFTLSAAAIALSVASLAAQQIVVPSAFAAAEGGTTGNVWRAGLNRVQCFYDTTNFTGQATGQPITISAVEFRLAGALATNIITYPSVEIHLQNSAVDFLTPSTTFATNRSAVLGTPNYSGPVTTVAVGGGTPNDYFISIPLTTPFTYQPELGQDLLMEIVINAAPTPLLGNTINAGFSAATHFANSVRSVNSTTALTGTASAFAPVARFTYTNAPGAALKSDYGVGCYDRAASIYEVFAGSSNDLSGQKVTFTQNAAGGYDAVTTAGAAVVLPPAGTVGLALGDDAVSAVQTLPFTFNFPGGATTGVIVDSNGSLGIAGTVGSSIGGTAAALLGLPSVRLAASMQDLLPDGATNVANVFAHADARNPSIFYYTWVNVPCFGSIAVPAPTSTFQIALIDNGTNDRVEFRYQTLVNDSSSNTGIAITGFSRGSGATDPGSSDLTAATVSSVAELKGLKLSASARPVINTSLTFTTSNIPASTAFTLYVLSVGQINPGVDLGIIGAPGCNAYIQLPEVLSNFQIGGPTATTVVSIPNDPFFVGQSFYSQAIGLDASANAAGITSSSAVSCLMGSL